MLHGYCLPSIYPPCTDRRKIIHVKTSSSVGNPLTLFSLSQKAHQYPSPVLSLCQNCSAELPFPDGRSIFLLYRYVSLTILCYDDKHLQSCAPCTLVRVTGSPACCSCAAPGSHPTFYTRNICSVRVFWISLLPLNSRSAGSLEVSPCLHLFHRHFFL